MDKQQIAIQNHNLIYGFAHKKRLDLDEYYDLLAIAYCEAVEVFDHNKGELSTIAYLKMQQALDRYKKQHKPRFYYEPYTYTKENGYDEVDNEDLFRYIRTQLTEKQIIVFDYWIEGYSQSDIADILNVSKQNIQQIVQKCIDKIKEELDGASS